MTQQPTKCDPNVIRQPCGKCINRYITHNPIGKGLCHGEVKFQEVVRFTKAEAPNEKEIEVEYGLVGR